MKKNHARAFATGIRPGRVEDVKLERKGSLLGLHGLVRDDPVRHDRRLVIRRDGCDASPEMNGKQDGRGQESSHE